MKFIVTRTSQKQADPSKPPCKFATYELLFPAMVERAEKDAELREVYMREAHAWTVEIETLDELLEWAKHRRQDIIIVKGAQYPTLEIYDDWRE